MKIKKLGLILSMFLICNMLSGCWDKIEIDRKAFISTIGIDVGKDIKNTKELAKLKPSDPFQKTDINRLHITFGFPDISELGPGKSGSPKEKSISVDAYSMEDGISQATERSSREIYLGQSKLILFSSDILKNKDIVKEIIDYLERNPSINKNMYAAVCEGSTETYIKYEPTMETNIENYISGLMDNSGRNSTILPVTLNELLILLSQNGNAILPNLKYDRVQNQMFISSTAIIKDYELKGSLNPSETGSIEILRGKLKGGKKVVYIDTHPVDFIMDGVERHIKVTNSNPDNIMVRIDIAIEGKITGYTVGKDIFSSEKLNQIQEDVSKSTIQECERTIRFTQKVVDVDPIGIRENIEKYHPILWKKVKDKWDKVYANMHVKVNVTTHIRRIGVSK